MASDLYKKVGKKAEREKAPSCCQFFQIIHLFTFSSSMQQQQITLKLDTVETSKRPRSKYKHAQFISLDPFSIYYCNNLLVLAKHTHTHCLIRQANCTRTSKGKHVKLQKISPATADKQRGMSALVNIYLRVYTYILDRVIRVRIT